ncbi:MAG: hypothetical protein ACTHPS_18135 [Streptosporangiaceae bacterium]
MAWFLQEEGFEVTVHDAPAHVGVAAAIQSSAMVAAFDGPSQPPRCATNWTPWLPPASSSRPTNRLMGASPAGFAHHGPARSPPNPA